MRTISLYFIAALLVAAQAQMTAKEYVEICNKEHGVTNTELKQFIDSKMDPAKATNPIKCHMKCVIEKLGFYKNNMLDEALAAKFFKEHNKDQQANVETIKQTIQKCNQMKGADPCDTAYQIVTCFVKSELPMFAV
ncbi:general odorant-binding protein 56d [Zeugodacus cucurbitae]|uniref:general odorant-binding protein 56d n=1 Tax=Zeugodacus cucurbitae TaxID=28588 RepID=UPI0023D8F1F4|nr:general odorant-binding protein 56d [Zeugodacus cucurbitae]